MNKEIIVNVLVEGERAYIIFNFDEIIRFEITSDNTEKIQNIFYQILQNIINDNEIKFKFVRNNDDLYNDVAEKYVKDLNSELNTLINDFLNPLKNSANK